MERSIVTLKRLFSKDIKTEQNNVMQNICVFRVILFCFVICTSMAILNISRIFIVDHKIMTWGYMGICVVSVSYTHLGNLTQSEAASRVVLQHSAVTMELM